MGSGALNTVKAHSVGGLMSAFSSAKKIFGGVKSTIRSAGEKAIKAGKNIAGAGVQSAVKTTKAVTGGAVSGASMVAGNLVGVATDLQVMSGAAVHKISARVVTAVPNIVAGVQRAGEMSSNFGMISVEKVRKIPQVVGSATHAAGDFACDMASNVRGAGQSLIDKMQAGRKDGTLKHHIYAVGGAGIALIALMQSVSSNNDNFVPSKIDSAETFENSRPGVKPWHLAIAPISAMISGLSKSTTAQQEQVIQGAVSAKTIGGVTAGSVLVGGALQKASSVTGRLVGYRPAFRTGVAMGATGRLGSTIPAAGMGVSRFVQKSVNGARSMMRAVAQDSLSYLETCNIKLRPMDRVLTYLEQLEASRMVSLPQRALTYLDQLESARMSSAAAKISRQSIAEPVASAVKQRLADAAKSPKVVADVAKAYSGIVLEKSATAVTGGWKSVLQKVVSQISKDSIKENVKKLAKFVFRLKLRR